MNSKLLLSISIFLNIGLLTGLMLVYPLGDQNQQTPGQGHDIGESVAITKQSDKTSGEPEELCARCSRYAESEQNKTCLDLQAIESGNFVDYAASLQSAGLPEDMIKSIVTAAIDKKYEDLKAALLPPRQEVEYWKSSYVPFSSGVPDESTFKEIQDLARERRELLKEILGSDYREDPKESLLSDGMNALRQTLDFLPPELLTQVLELEQRSGAKLMRLGDGEMDFQNIMMNEIYREKDRELLLLLGTENKERYDLRLSKTANSMRISTNQFEFTEREFIEVFRIRKRFDDRMGHYDVEKLSRDELQVLKQEEELFNQEIESALGRDRYAQYIQAQFPIAQVAGHSQSSN